MKIESGQRSSVTILKCSGCCWTF